MHFLSAVRGCLIFFHWLGFHSAWETATTSLISHGFPEKVAGGAARKTGHTGPGGKGRFWSQDLRAALSVARQLAEGIMPCSEGRRQPCPCLKGSFQAVVPGHSLPGGSWQSRGHAAGLEEVGGPGSPSPRAYSGLTHACTGQGAK